MKIYPVCLMLEDRPCLLVGAGTVALKKARRLLAARARLRVVAPRVRSEFRALAKQGKIELRERAFRPEDADGIFLVTAAANDEKTNAEILRVSRERGAALCSAVDAGWRAGDFMLPAVVESARGNLTFAVSSGGENHRAARAAADALRSGFAEKISDEAERKSAEAAAAPRERRAGKIVVAGAGVGRGNISLNVVAALRECDVCVHDALIPEDALGFVPAQARKIDVGKREHRHAFPQKEISEMCVRFARQGLRVVRLKGGDPTIFARLREELDAFRAAGVSWEILPGVSAFQAAAAAESLPLTERSRARAVTLVTGRTASGEDGDDGDFPAPRDGRQIIYMGIRAFPRIAAKLRASGVPAETPVRAVFGCGDARREFSVAGTLDSLVLPETDLPGILFVGF